jgi:hypothetical protein
MKLSLLAIVSLIGFVGCAEAQAPAPATPTEATVPSKIATGADNGVEWTCQLTEFNEKLAWVPCEFRSRAPGWMMHEACTKVVFYEASTMNPVAESRILCSGPLAFNQTSVNYAAFRENTRTALQRCGDDLHLCVMLANRAQ